MRLYSGTSLQFIHDTVQNQIAEKLKAAFFEYNRYNPSPQEISSWRNSLRAIKDVVQEAKLTDHGVILEYQLPLTSRRLDFLICGEDGHARENAVIVELKQWEECDDSDGEYTVVTRLGRAPREVLHPSVQVSRYAMYLRDMHTAFYEGSLPVNLSACSYLHNYSFSNDDPLLADKFLSVLAECPSFSEDDFSKITGFLSERLEGGKGIDVLCKVEQSKHRPSKKLMDHVGKMIRGNKEYVLLDEQLIVYDRVLTSAKQGFHDKKKTVILVKGGPGTGKSVIAINLMADLLLNEYNAHYATGSRAFTETLRKIIGPRGGVQFKYFNSYREAENNEIDVLICDESHRIRETSNSRFTAAKGKSDVSQVDELIKAAKVLVFLIDDDQVVRPGEVGSSQLIMSHAEGRKCKIHEYELQAQFRCMGSDAFVNWINNTLGIRRTANVLWGTNEDFDFQIIENPFLLEKAIREKVMEGYSARVTAGFCWDWSKPNPDGTLVNDVVIGNYKKPWNARPEATRLARPIPKALHWAHDPNGIDQIGCVYTAQGFEFDYVGVIWGMDLTYDFDKQTWVGNPEESKDSVVRRSRDRFADLVKNTYRVLLSRGLKGCYVCFVDKNTERFIKSRIELVTPQVLA